MSNEKPILFKDEMIRAILEGRKTQTRRVVKSPAKNMQASGAEVIKHREPGDKWYGDHVWSMRGSSGVWGDYTHERFLSMCPYGKPGDRLWVRENFLQLMHGQVTDGRVKYCASIDPRSTGTPKNDGYWWRKRPSIHMPRWASRITLEITDVRVERLCNITESDAEAEGVEEEWRNGEVHGSAKDVFSKLWESINGAGSWDANPWVWCISFKRIDA